jgi:hypothetical protein
MDDAEGAARERLAALFRAIKALSPDELARIGYRAAPPDERKPVLDAIAAAAAESGRGALVAEARDAARRAVMGRYASGMLHPTIVGLNWGLSQGTVEDRIAIAETLADAAAGAVLEDVLDPEVAAALAGEAAAITGLAGGEAYDGSLGRLLRDPVDPALGPGRAMRLSRRAGVVTLVALSALAAGLELALLAGASIVAVVAARRGGRGRPGGDAER